METRIHFAETDRERIERNWHAWWMLELDRPLIMVEGREHPAVEYYPHVFADLPPEDIITQHTPNLVAMRWYGDAFPKAHLNFGPGIVAGFLGARVLNTPLSTWFEPAEGLDLEDIHPRYDADNAWWARVREVTIQAVEQWEGKVAVSHTDLGGNLDILASLRGSSRLLFDLYDRPEEINRLIGEVTGLWLRYYRELDAIIRPACHGTTPWAPIWSPGTTYMLQCDLSCMFSPDMFECFVLPDLNACCEALDHAFYHLDGPDALPHLDALLAIPRLRGVQWVPTDRRPGADEWLPLLKRIVDSGKLCQVYVSAKEALNIVRHIGGKGFALYVNDRMEAEEASAFLREMAAVDVSQTQPQHRW
jgi:5-methyltetrahydrofolate--homocysteine methyltransferase